MDTQPTHVLKGESLAGAHFVTLSVSAMDSQPCPRQMSPYHHRALCLQICPPYLLSIMIYVWCSVKSSLSPCLLSVLMTVPLISFPVLLFPLAGFKTCTSREGGHGELYRGVTDCWYNQTIFIHCWCWINAALQCVTTTSPIAHIHGLNTPIIA